MVEACQRPPCGRHVLAVEGVSDGSQRLTVGPVSGDALTCLVEEGDGAAESGALGFHGLERVGGAGPDDAAFPLGYGTGDVGCEFAGGGGHVHIDVEGDDCPTLAAG